MLVTKQTQSKITAINVKRVITYYHMMRFANHVAELPHRVLLWVTFKMVDKTPQIVNTIRKRQRANQGGGINCRP